MATSDPLAGTLPVGAGGGKAAAAPGGAGAPPALSVTTPPTTASSTTPGLNAAEEALPVYVPINLGQHGAANIRGMTVGDFVAYVMGDPSLSASWTGYLNQLGLFTNAAVQNGSRAPTPAELRSALESVGVSAAVRPDHNIDSWLTDRGNQAAPPGSAAAAGTQQTGSARFFKGTTTEIALTGRAAATAATDQAYQQLLGRHATADEITSVLGNLNMAEVAEGTVRAQAAQATQAGYYEAYTGGSEGGGAAGAPGAPTTVSMSGTGSSALAALPKQYAAALQHLAANGQLSGLDPNVIAAVAMAESSGTGGAVNPQGYGGFFGLAPGQSYPGGHTVDSATMVGTSVDAFTKQAVTAAAEFASLLNQFHGDIYLAETAYQQGPNSAAVKAGTPGGEGVGVMKKYGIAQQTVAPTNAQGVPTDIAAPPPAGSAAAPGPGPASATTAPVGGPALPTSGIPAPGTYTMGSETTFNTPTGTDYVLPAQAAVVGAAPTPAEQAASEAMNAHPVEYQSHNLLGVFGAIAQALAAGTPGAGKNVLNTPVKAA